MPLFAGKEAILPFSTRMLMAASRSLSTYGWLYGLGAVAAVIGVRGFLRSPPGRSLRDRLAVTLPVIGPLTNKILTGQLLRTLGHLLESHVPLTDALTVTRMTMQNRFYCRLIDQVEEIVRGGGRLSQAFLSFTYMPGTVRQMIATGEEAGNVYPVMLRLARHYDGEIEQELKRVASLIEPIALIFLGSVVGVIVASVILPLFKLAHAIG
jgi:type II secretory pathway component PulF